MYIYKITNIINNKIYIGLTNKNIYLRFRRHINDAINCKLNTHFARAIRKYKPNNFKIEIIDLSTNLNELNLKELYWILHYNSIKFGYNETDAIYKCGGNTYKFKSVDELNIIKEKIRLTKIGVLNPNSKKIILTNTKTNETLIFNTIIECAKYLGIKSGKTSITTRLNGKIKSLFRGKYKFDYYNNECVSTNSDECKSVESEISTDSKQETIE